MGMWTRSSCSDMKAVLPQVFSACHLIPIRAQPPLSGPRLKRDQILSLVSEVISPATNKTSAPRYARHLEGTALGGSRSISSRSYATRCMTDTALLKRVCPIDILVARRDVLDRASCLKCSRRRHDGPFSISRRSKGVCSWGQMAGHQRSFPELVPSKNSDCGATYITSI